MERALKDADLIITKAMPAAAATANSASIDLEQTPPNELPVEVLIEVPALPALEDGKDATITFQDSADDSSFAAVDQIAAITLTGAGGAGASATSMRFRLPSDIRRYIRFSAAVEAAGGDNTAVDVTMSLIF